MEIVVTQEKLEREAERLAYSLTPQNSATIIALYGDLGAGKTTFTKAFAKALGVGTVVTSPTFVIEKIYKLEEQAFARLVHIDAYRLKGPEELVQIGWNIYSADSKNIIVVEWAEYVEKKLPREAIKIHLSVKDHDTRTLSYGN
jgi:tRNA threonylcarbamoyladenosine biosynthesis protein TsaE